MGKKRLATITLFILGVASFLIKQLGENVLGTVYSSYIAPWLEARVFFYTEQEMQCISSRGEETAQIVEQAHAIEILWVSFACLAFILFWSWILGKYYSAVNSIRISQEQMLTNAVEALVNDEPYIQSAQIYRYDIVSSGINFDKRIVIDYIGSRYQNGLDINAVVHEEFVIPDKTYRMTKAFSKQLSIYERTRLIADREKAEKIVNKYTNQKKRYFQKLTINNITERDCIDYIIYKGIQSTLGRETLDSAIEGVAEDVTLTLLHGKRTGCIPTILLRSVYIFRNGQSSFKKDRAYWFFVPNKDFLPNGYRNILVVLTMSYSHIEKHDYNYFSSDLVEALNSALEAYVKRGANQ